MQCAFPSGESESLTLRCTRLTGASRLADLASFPGIENNGGAEPRKGSVQWNV
jgi:hypothetical protein